MIFSSFPGRIAAAPALAAPAWEGTAAAAALGAPAPLSPAEEEELATVAPAEEVVELGQATE